MDLQIRRLLEEDFLAIFNLQTHQIIFKCFKNILKKMDLQVSIAHNRNVKVLLFFD